MPPDEADRIFERFHRGQADRISHGAGLGLPIVAAIAHAHHGRVFVEHPPANVGSGVVFVLDLPAVDLVDGEPRTCHRDGGVPMTHILIAEDEERIAAFVAKGLRASGFETSAVTSGEEALARVQSGDVDLLDPRPGARRHRRLRGAAPAACGRRDRPGDRADRAVVGDGHRHRPGVGRRRLHGQAVPLRGAAGPGAAAAAGAGRGGAARPRCSGTARSSSTCGRGG